jgi:hypothetical protein
MNKSDVRLRVPAAPNYISLDIPGAVQSGMGGGAKVTVASLTDAEKDWLAAEWRKELDKVAERQKANPEPTYRAMEKDGLGVGDYRG